MSDNGERLELPQAPAWLQQGTAPLAEVAPGPAPDPAPDPAPIEGDPIPELAPEPAIDPRILSVANGLVQFKRFWTAPAGTSNEMDAAIAFAVMIAAVVDIEKAEKAAAPEEITDADQPKPSRSRRKPS